MNSVRTWVQGQAGAAEAAIARLTPRERWLSALGLVTVLAVAAAQALQWSGDQRQRYTLAQADLALARQRAVQGARAGDGFDRAQAQALASWSQDGRSLWLARLQVEQRIRAAAESARLQNARVSLAETLDEGAVGGLGMLRAEINGPYQGGALAELLKRLSLDDKAYVLDSLQVTQGDAASYKLVLLFPVRVGQSEAGR